MKAFRAVQLSWHRSPLAQVAAKNRRGTRRDERLALTPANELLNANRLGRDQDPLQIVHVPTRHGHALCEKSGWALRYFAAIQQCSLVQPRPMSLITSCIQMQTSPVSVVW